MKKGGDTVDLALPGHVLRALEELEKNGYESWVVGGCVRDRLLGRTPEDYDICTAARPEETLAVFARERTIPTGIAHGTVTLLCEAGPLEITTFRADGEYSDRRHPDAVGFVETVAEDLRRRDFTVNAMAYNPRRGLRDLFGGQEDLHRGLIRCVGDPDERFQEDALRILRALRFASRCGFAIEEATAAALRRNRRLLSQVSRERIFGELRGFLCGPGAGELLLAFPEVIFAVLPELEPMWGFDHRLPSRHCWDVWGHTAHAAAVIDPDPILRLAMLFHDSGKPAVYQWDELSERGRFYGHPTAGAALADRALRSLRCDNETRETVVTLVRYHEMRGGHDKSALRRLLARLGEADFRRLLKVRRADAAAHAPGVRPELLALADGDERMLEELLSEGVPRTIRELPVGGKELMELGYRGPAIRMALEILLSEVLGGTLPPERESLLCRAAERKEKLMFGGDTMKENVDVKWLGHSCFKLSWKGFTLVTDPYQDGSVPGYPPLRERASAVYCSHGHRDHGAADLVTLTGEAAPEGFAVEEFNGPHDHHNGERRGMNTIRQFRFGALRVVHMGDVGCVPAEETLRELRGCDLLLLPVGGYFTVNAAEAYEIYREIAPRAVVPMHYWSAEPAFGYEVLGPVDAFLQYFPAAQVERLTSDSFTLSDNAPRGVVVPKYPF